MSDPKSTSTEKPERIAKVVARSGLCSRREAERWIGLGKIAVDGKTLKEPGVTVTAKNTITVDGKPIPEVKASQLWRYHKPPGLLTSHSDPKGRPCLFDRLPKELGRVISIGRLDMNSEGLLLLTNDGELSRRLELPSTGWTRRYRVRVYGQVDEARLEKLARGITVDGVTYGPITAKLENRRKHNSWLTMSLTEGKNREVRKVLEHQNLQVTRLIRIAYGPFQLGQLQRGIVAKITGKALREQLGKALKS